ncbi:V-type ATP synthase subunit I [Desulfobacterota bacterium M19]
MIVPMRKVTILGHTAWQDKMLGAVRDLGVVHIIPLDSVDKLINEAEFSRVKGNINLLEEAVGLIAENSASDQDELEIDALACAQELLMIHERRKKLQKEIRELEEEYKGLGVWGDFSPERLELMQDKGLKLKFFLTPVHNLDKLPPEIIACKIGREGNRLLLAVFDFDKAGDWMREVSPPPRGKRAIEAVLAQKKKNLGVEELKIKQLKRVRPALLRCLSRQRERLAFIDAGRAMGARGGICYLSGFCPLPGLAALKDEARRRQWGLFIEEPQDTEPVPTLIKYSRWSVMLKPVMDFLGVIPGYREFDCSGPSLFFFIIFSAILIGDAGYGCLFLLISIFFIYRGSHPREPYILLLISAAATVVWGALTGTWFGIEGLEHTAFLGAVVYSPLTPSAPDSAFLVMHICFFIGAIQLILAHLWLAGRKFPQFKALADIGWALVVEAIYFIALFLVLNKSMPPLTFLLLSGGGVLILLFSEQSNGFSLAVFARSIARSPLTLLSGINSLSDLISYIRLFAVGLATREVALAVNHMALSVGFETILSSIAAVVILLAGHGLNIILGAMAILVHGVRLNLLEFSRHLEINWSGNAYAPFNRKIVSS